VVGLDIKPTESYVPLVVGDMHYLPFRPSTFDVIVFCHALENTPPPSAVLDEAYTVAKNDGK